MSINFNNLDQFTNDVVHEIARQKEVSLLSQLNWLVSRGIIVMETQGPTLVKTYLKPNEDGYEIRLEESVKLVVKDKEYIEKLEKENRELNQKLQRLAEVFTNGI